MKPIIRSYDIKNDSRILTLAAVQERLNENNPESGFMVTVGHSVKSPEDKMNGELAGVIASGRARKGYAFAIFCAKRLSKGFIERFMDSIADEIELNFDSFIPLGSKNRPPQKVKENDTVQRPSNDDSVRTGPAGKGSKERITK